MACGATPLAEASLCFWHDPEHAEAASEARRLGGQRRRREGLVAGTYGVEGLETIADLRRVLQVVVTDTLAQENSASRSRTLIAAVAAGAKLMETGTFEERLTQLETVMETRLKGGKR
jgi:hypothetical protein